MKTNHPQCPTCGGFHTWKKGKHQSGKQRYYCADCQKRFVIDSEKYRKKIAQLHNKPPEIEGVLPHEAHDFEADILPYLIKIGQQAKTKTEREKIQKITMPNKPFMLAIMADVHGGAKTDYEAIYEDVNRIKNNPDIYAILAGDLTDNFIIGKLQSIQKEQSTTFQMEQRFLVWFLENLESSLIAVVSGNHDNWTKKLSGFDITRHLLRNVRCLYDRNQVVFDLLRNGYKTRFLVRHKYKHSSIFNPTHGMEVFWERGGLDWDIAIGGHTHIATLCRPFIKHDRKRFAVLLGTYKLRDEYGRELGFADTHSDSRGSGCFVFRPDSDTPIWFDSLEDGEKFLEYLKYEY